MDGVRRSLATGFVYTNHDLPEDVIDEAYSKLAQFFSMDQATKEKFIAPGSHGQTGYTGLLVETAASAEVPDWKEMLNWSDEPPAGHPLRRKYPHRYMDQVLPEAAVRLTRLDEESGPNAERRDTRRRVALEELVPAGGDVAATKSLVARLASAGLVVTSRKNLATAAQADGPVP